MTTELWAIGLVVLGGIIGSFGPIYIKAGAEKITLKRLSSIYKNPFLIIGIIIYAISILIFIPALRGGELSVLYPLVSLVYIWVTLNSRILLNEKITKEKCLGIFLIIIGVIFIGLGA